MCCCLCRHNIKLHEVCITDLHVNSYIHCHGYAWLNWCLLANGVNGCTAFSTSLRIIHRLVSQPVLLSQVTSLIMTRLDTSSATLAWSLCSPFLMQRHILSVMLQTYTGHGLKNEYNSNWLYSFSAAIISRRPHNSSAIFTGLIKWSFCDDHGPALNTTWSWSLRFLLRPL